MISKIDARKGSNSLLPPELDGAVVTGDFLSYTFDESRVSKDYFDLVVTSPSFAELCDTISAGTTNRVRLDVPRFLELSMAVPPIPEQDRIVDLIGAVDEVIEGMEEKSDVLWSMTQKLLDAAFNTFPKVQAGDLIASISGGKSPSAEGRPPTEDEFGVLKVSAINECGFLPAEAKTISDPGIFSSSMSVRAGDVLISRANTPERVGLVCLVQDDYPNLFLCDKTLRISPKDGVDPAALVAVLGTAEAREQIQISGTGTSGSMKNISQEAIRHLSVKWPTDIEEQSRIGALHQNQIEVINRVRATAESLRTLRTELLSALQSGAHRIPVTYDELMGA